MVLWEIAEVMAQSVCFMRAKAVAIYCGLYIQPARENLVVCNFALSRGLQICLALVEEDLERAGRHVVIV